MQLIYRFCPPLQFTSRSLIASANVFVHPCHCGFYDVCFSIRKVKRIHSFNKQCEFENIRLLEINKAQCLVLILEIFEACSGALRSYHLGFQWVEFLRAKHSLPEVTLARIEILRCKIWGSSKPVRYSKVQWYRSPLNPRWGKKAVNYLFRKQLVRLVSKWNRIAKLFNQGVWKEWNNNMFYRWFLAYWVMGMSEG